MKTQKKSAYEMKTATTTKHNKNKNSNTNTVNLLSPIKSSVLILTRPRARNTGLRRIESIKGKIVATLIKLKNRGLAEGTLRNISFNLKHLSKHSNLDDPESVKEYIAKKDCANSQKMNLVKSYNHYAVINGIQ